MLSHELKIKLPKFDRNNYLSTKNFLGKHKLNTVCIEANCPNRYECFSEKKASFMILGNVCTRNCKYCNVGSGIPKNPDAKEPQRIAVAVKNLALDYVVITTVTRDDLKDGGASQFVNVIKEIRKKSPLTKIEVLISDLNGNWEALKKIIDAKPDIINHNIEVVRGLFAKLRPNGNYDMSLELLEKTKKINPKMITKSGLMLGLGETKEQIISTLKDLNLVKCDMITMGQYLQPSLEHAPILKIYKGNEFAKLKQAALKIGFQNVFAGKLVRSSYHAKEMASC